MPLLDLSIVSKTLVKLVAARVQELLAIEPAATAHLGPVQVTALPADQLSGSATIGVYLYRGVEDPHVQNFRPPVPGAPPASGQPMGWRLYYQVSAYSDLPDNEAAVYREQTLLGLALKALHDFPVLDTSTRIASAAIFPESLQGAEICFRISPLPDSSADAAHAGTSTASRRPLVACYHVAVAGSSRRG